MIRAVRWRQQAERGARHRGLAGAGLADQGHRFAFAHHDRHVLHSGDACRFALRYSIDSAFGLQQGQAVGAEAAIAISRCAG